MPQPRCPECNDPATVMLDDSPLCVEHAVGPMRVLALSGLALSVKSGPMPDWSAEEAIEEAIEEVDTDEDMGDPE